MENQGLIDVLAVILNAMPEKSITIPSGENQVEGNFIQIDEGEGTLTLTLVSTNPDVIEGEIVDGD